MFLSKFSYFLNIFNIVILILGVTDHNIVIIVVFETFPLSYNYHKPSVFLS